MASNSYRLSTRDHTIELEGTSLQLVDLKAQQDQMTHTLKWTIPNYYRLLKKMTYVCHQIRIGQSFHRLRILKYDPKLQVGGMDQRIVYLLIGLTPAVVWPRVKASFTLLGGRDCEVLPVNGLKNVLRYISYRECYVEFLDTIPTDSPNLVVLCRIACMQDEMISLEIVKSNQIFTDLEAMRTNGLFADTIIAVEDREFPAHRAILGARSSVFSAMFQNEMAEKFNNQLTIEDTDADTFENFLGFLYTGKTGVLTADRASDLLPLADKYDIQDLKRELTEFLRWNLSVEHVLRIVLLAQLHNEAVLKNEAITFIANNLKLVMRQPEWSRFKSQNDLMEDVLRHLAN